MKDFSEEFKKSISDLLKEKLSSGEADALKAEGFNIKKPTRMTVIMAALYKRAASGDLSAIKEIRSILSGGVSENGEGRVTIIDDLRA